MGDSSYDGLCYLFILNFVTDLFILQLYLYFYFKVIL